MFEKHPACGRQCVGFLPANTPPTPLPAAWTQHQVLITERGQLTLARFLFFYVKRSDLPDLLRFSQFNLNYCDFGIGGIPILLSCQHPPMLAIKVCFHQPLFSREIKKRWTYHYIALAVSGLQVNCGFPTFGIILARNIFEMDAFCLHHHSQVP